MVLAIVDVRTELELCPSVEDDHMRRSTELKSANRLTFHHFVSHIHNRDAAGDLNHADFDDSHLANSRIMRVNDEYMPGRDAAKKGLRVVVIVDPAHIEAWILKEITTRKKVGTFYSS